MFEFDLGYFIFMDSVENRSRNEESIPREEESPKSEIGDEENIFPETYPPL